MWKGIQNAFNFSNLSISRENEGSAKFHEKNGAVSNA